MSQKMSQNLNTKQAQLISNKKTIKIIFPFNYDDLNNVKTLSGRKFHGDQYPKYWTCPLNIDSIKSLKGWGFVLDEKLNAFLEKKKLPVNTIPDNLQIPGLKKHLMPFQKKAVIFIEAKDGRALIADEQGLGKTIESVAWLQLHPEKRPAIIVVPATLKLNWETEAHDWMSNPKTQLLSGEKGKPLQTTKDIIIINYDILPNQYEKYIDSRGKKKEREIINTGWVDFLIACDPKILITDECHLYKSNTAHRTKAIKKLGKHIPHIIALSGTPIISRPVELFNAIKLVDPTVVSNFWAYAQRYCGAKHNGFGWDFTGASHTEELHEKLTNSIMLRRLKKDVLPDLPDKMHTVLAMEIDNSTEYRQAENNFIAWITENKGKKAAEKASNAEAFAQIETLKQLAIKGKMKQCIEWIENFLHTDEKLVVFTTHKNTIDTLMQKFGEKAVKIDGSVSGQARQDAVHQFQNDNTCKLFIGNIKAAGIGITLTAASNIAFLELPWTPGEVVQAEDRCHRIGQKNAVNIYYLLGSKTIDEKIAQMLDGKKKILDSVLDGTETVQESLLTSLINEYKEKSK